MSDERPMSPESQLAAEAPDGQDTAAVADATLIDGSVGRAHAGDNSAAQSPARAKRQRRFRVAIIRHFGARI